MTAPTFGCKDCRLPPPSSILSTNTYHNTLIFLSWLSVLGLFLACTIRSAMKKRWMMTSLNLAMVILFFMSLMVLPYRI